MYSNNQDFDKNYGERIDATIEIVDDLIENESLIVKIIDFM